MVETNGEPALLTLLTIACWTLCAPLALGQEQTTTVQLSGGPPRTVSAIENSATTILSEFNRAANAGRRPRLSGPLVTREGRMEIQRRWNESSFYCTEPRLTRRLAQRADGSYEIRNIPLIIEDEREQREAIMSFNADGEVFGLVYTGSVIVHTRPSGASVKSMARDTSADAPARFEDLPARDQRFVIQKRGYRRLDTTLAVRPGAARRDTVQLEQGYGNIHVEGVSGQATVRVDGKRRSFKGDQALRVRAGTEHTVIVSRRYYRSQDTTLSVGTGQTKTIRPQLERKQSSLEIKSEPKGASVTVTGDALSGSVTGATPFQTQVEQGRTYEVRVAQSGYIPSVRTVAVGTNSSVTRRVSLGRLTAQSSDDVLIRNLQATRTDEGVAITYDLLRTGISEQNSVGTFKITLSVIVPPNDRSLAIASQDVYGAVGEAVAPGPNKEIELKRSIPGGATVQLMATSPSQAESLTFGRRSAPASSSDTLGSSLNTFRVSGENGTLAVGVGRGDAFSISGSLGGNVYLTRFIGTVPLAMFIPIRLRAGYQQDALSNFKYFRAGLGTGVGGRLHFTDLQSVRRKPVIGNLVIEGALTFTPGYFHDYNGASSQRPLGRTRTVDLAIKLVDLIGAGGGRDLGLTLGFTHRTVGRREADSVGDYFARSFGSFDSVVTQRLFHIGINLK
ncbi:MAG: PEGA domain-containing protein [Salinibacter sp.]|uniref:PEGA domain-containing protein n=1 Tax=Salinibacter sp. TaxID=2065818 RepID=UPI0035D4AFEC